jgi:hypothetical protein
MFKKLISDPEAAIGIVSLFLITGVCCYWLAELGRIIP